MSSFEQITNSEESINQKFYVDDGADNAETEEKASELAQGLISLCKQGGFTLTKFVSNSRNVMKSISQELWHPDIINLQQPLPLISVLGINYDAENDVFRAKPIARKSGGKMTTRSDVLSAVMSIFDPLGFVSP